MVNYKDLTSNQLRVFSQFDNHVTVRYFSDESTQLQGVIALHRATSLRPAFGATRMADYPSLDTAIVDALTLSRFMSYKSALAGLPYWGAKAVIIRPSGKYDREALLRSYAEVVNSLDGRFVTGADLGIFPQDVEIMKQVSAHMVGVYNDPVYFTGLGLIESIRQTARTIWKTEDLSGISFAIQGAGKIGEALLKMLYPYSPKISIADIDQQRLDQIKEIYPNVQIVSHTQILAEPVDFLCPCAHGGILNENTVDKLNCRVVLGGANSQLESDKIGDLLLDRGIVFVPDYVVNAGGLISVVDEYLHHDGNEERVRQKVNQLVQTVAQLFEENHHQPLQLHRIANNIAEQIFSQYD